PDPTSTEPRRTAPAGTRTAPRTPTEPRTPEPRTTEPRSTANPDTTEPETPAARAARLVTESRTFAAEAGIATRDTPSSVFRLLVLSCLLAAPVQHATALRAARALRPATRSAAALARTPVEEVSRHLTAAGYWRFHRTKGALLVRAAGDVVDRLDGDLRTLYPEATSAAELHQRCGACPAPAPTPPTSCSGRRRACGPICSPTSTPGSSTAPLASGCRPIRTRSPRSSTPRTCHAWPPAACAPRSPAAPGPREPGGGATSRRRSPTRARGRRRPPGSLPGAVGVMRQTVRLRSPCRPCRHHRRQAPQRPSPACRPRRPRW